jgi:hypothetical protein
VIRLAQRQREIHRSEALAFAGQRAGRHHDPDAAFHLRDVQRGRELAILLERRRRKRIGAHELPDQFGIVLP